MTNRMSVYSTMSGLSQGPPRPSAQQTTQVSTTTLLNALHNSYASAQPYQLEAGTSLVINTWLTTTNAGPNGEVGGTIDPNLARRAWEHARRRAEDGCIVLCSSHQSSPSILSPFLASIPLSTPEIAYAALSAIRPFVSQVTPYNPARFQYSALAVTYTFTLTGRVTELQLALSTSGLNTSSGLFNLPVEAGYRAFDVFYYLLTSASTQAEREFLDLKDPSAYTLLNRSGTYNPPSYLPAADDTASAEDFRACLKAIGIKGAALRNLLSVLAALLKLGNAMGLLVDEEEIEEVCEEVGGLLNVDPLILLRDYNTDEREALMAGIYDSLLDWVISKANEAIRNDLHPSLDTGSSDGGPSGSGPVTDDDNGDTVGLTVIEIPDPALGKAIAMRGVFDDSLGINAEIKEDGVEVISPGHSVIKEMQNAVAEVGIHLGVTSTTDAREREYFTDKVEGVLEKIGVEVEPGCFLRHILYPVEGEGISFGKRGRFDLSHTLGSSRVWYHASIHPTDDMPDALASLPSTTSAWSAATVSRQLRAWRFPEWANRRNKSLDFTADFDVEEFVTRYSLLGCQEGKDGVENWIIERGWSNGDVVLGNERIWMRENAWWEAESMLDLKPQTTSPNPFNPMMNSPFESGYTPTPPPMTQGSYFPMENMSIPGSRENLLHRQGTGTFTNTHGAQSIAPTIQKPAQNTLGDYGLGPKGDDKKYDDLYYDHELGRYVGQLDPEYGESKKIEQKKIMTSRRVWTTIVWMLTFWIPSFVLRFVGRMKRPDVRMAWREKIVLMLLIALLNGIIVFYIVFFGDIICPGKDKVWNEREVGYHQGDNDFYVSIRGKVYDISKFWKVPHSNSRYPTTKDYMREFAGKNLDAYFPVPLTQACPGFGVSKNIRLDGNGTEAGEHPNAIHTSGPEFQTDRTIALNKIDWYSKTFQPKIREYFKGDLVWTTANITAQASDRDRKWAIIRGLVYDLTDYFHTIDIHPSVETYEFLPKKVTDLFKNSPGTDLTDKWGDDRDFKNTLNCLNNQFYVGKLDFRTTPRCTVNNYLLLAFACVICAVILVKFLAALQLGTKRKPSAQDKFVVCQVPAYTEGEDQLRKAIDSLTALQYDNKRKLIFVVCDGMIVGEGNDRPTPKIVLDILGVDPKIDPPALPFRSVGEGSEQLNYGKVYSGLYEFEGNVVPYIVVVKVGKESEQTKSKPGNRGKRDSQVLLLRFLNRVHHRSPMSPLELEIFHQINNVIGVDPELYEYLFMVDADTSVREDSLNRLVASCSNDAKIAGICGETSLQNEERSWWTMIQVYEYYISHHLAKAFESLFGSVTCLPGCFCMYRLRTVDKGRPLIISDSVISDYAEVEVDTLHQKNLLSLGEDRFLTTLMTKHFPHMSYKFLPDAYASTAAPETWRVLLSQRRRWINSTIHNLAELIFLKDLCGFCCFSMRFVVFIDLFGTIILPATCIYIGYLIYLLSSRTSQIPYISLGMIAAVYGLQAIIFIIKRQWQHIGWMIIYLIAFPVYSFVLPIYSFWNQDNFTWGNTRIVIGEKGDKKVIAVDDEGFDPKSIPLQRWDNYALLNNLPGRRGNPAAQEKSYPGYTDEAAVEMDDMHSMYSSVKPASTILTGFPTQGPHVTPYAVPQPSPYLNAPGNRNSHMSHLTHYTEQPMGSRNSRHISMGNLSHYQDSPANASRLSGFGMGADSQSHLGVPQQHTRGSLSRPVSTVVDFRNAPSQGPDEATITAAIQSCLSEVDLDTVTKKQVRALVEQRLQTSLAGDKRAFLDRQIDTELANMTYTTSYALLEALYEAGVRYVFANLGSDHPAILEATVRGQRDPNGRFPKIITCPNEMVAMSMADGYTRVSGIPQCVLIHVDVGTQALGAALHNSSCGRTPVFIFAGLSPFTQEGELPGSRTEFIHWLQDVPDQKQIVSQYCRYTGELKTGKNVKQMVNRALQFATSAPKGPVYMVGAREVMEEEIEPYQLNQKQWGPILPSALPLDAVEFLVDQLVNAKQPLVIVGYTGRQEKGVTELVLLADSIRGLRVLDTAMSDMCFPADHPSFLGMRYGVHEAITTADVILVIDCDVPWIPTQCRPSESARIFQIDVDPLKQQMPVHYIYSEATYRADSATALGQLNSYISNHNEILETLEGPEYVSRGAMVNQAYVERIQLLTEQAATPSSGLDAPLNPAYLISQVRQACPVNTIWCIEAVTNSGLVAEHIRPNLPMSWINCGGGGLGWSGGAALGMKLATDDLNSARGQGKGKFVCQIVGDGTYLFSVPGSVYWISRRYNIPVLTIILNNKGWNAPRKSLLLVHPNDEGSRVSNEELNISFAPTPDYAGIAKAAAGGQLWAGRAASVRELNEQLPVAVESVLNGMGAVLEVQLDGTEGKYVGN
ncbi:hypothetical protein FQN57_007430 [Myotisia sp. PD_48]|nr:hypothetical protein FQN57_007430 [Myotisia sp. PD_48]